jgi:hypothetical protein
MKTINPVPIWSNGSNKNATIFDLIIVNDNLENTAVFYYALKSDTLVNLSEGNLTIGGQEYQNWDSNPSANEYAYNWAAQQLGITITGEYVPVEITSL